MASVVYGLEELYGDAVNFVVLDVDLDGPDQNGPFMEALDYNPRIRPGIYVLDPDGNVIAFWFGVVDGKVIQQVLVDAIQQYS